MLRVKSLTTLLFIHFAAPTGGGGTCAGSCGGSCGDKSHGSKYLILENI